MRILPGILLLVAGVAYPIAALMWLNQRMTRPPELTPRQVGLILAFNGVLPVSLIFWGLSLVVPRLESVLAVRVVATLAMLAALVLWILLRMASRANTEAPSETETGHGR